MIYSEDGERSNTIHIAQSPRILNKEYIEKMNAID